MYSDGLSECLNGSPGSKRDCSKLPPLSSLAKASPGLTTCTLAHIKCFPRKDMEGWELSMRRRALLMGKP